VRDSRNFLLAAAVGTGAALFGAIAAGTTPVPSDL
jgi:hypothetical protein